MNSKTISPSLFLYLTKYNEMDQLDTALNNDEIKQEKGETDSQYQEKLDKIRFIMNRAYNQTLQIIKVTLEQISEIDFPGKIELDNKDNKIRNNWRGEVHLKNSKDKKRKLGIAFDLTQVSDKPSYDIWIWYADAVTIDKSRKAQDLENYFRKKNLVNTNLPDDYNRETGDEEGLVCRIVMPIEENMDVQNLIQTAVKNFKDSVIDNWDKINEIAG
ncbi:MAG: hypothetical protein HQK52_17900 [Oligoflexia bacterium]|nr:hypothetical protein [Oligoflexia bacterium]